MDPFHGHVAAKDVDNEGVNAPIARTEEKGYIAGDQCWVVGKHKPWFIHLARKDDGLFSGTNNFFFKHILTTKHAEGLTGPRVKTFDLAGNLDLSGEGHDLLPHDKFMQEKMMARQKKRLLPAKFKKIDSADKQKEQNKLLKTLSHVKKHDDQRLSYHDKYGGPAQVVNGNSALDLTILPREAAAKCFADAFEQQAGKFDIAGHEQVSLGLLKKGQKKSELSEKQIEDLNEKVAAYRMGQEGYDPGLEYHCQSVLIEFGKLCVRQTNKKEGDSPLSYMCVSVRRRETPTAIHFDVYHLYYQDMKEIR